MILDYMTPATLELIYSDLRDHQIEVAKQYGETPYSENRKENLRLAKEYHKISDLMRDTEKQFKILTGANMNIPGRKAEQ